MADIGNNNFPSSPFTPTGTGSSAPPPPSEVKVRTMRSDLAAMAKSGGGLPRFENVKVEAQPAETAVAQKKAVSPMLITVLVFVVLVAIGFFAYLFWSSKMATPAATTTPQAAPPAPVTAPVQSAPVVAAVTPTSTATSTSVGPFTHVSLFKQPADQVLVLTLSMGLQTFDQQLSTLLEGANKTATVIEVDVKDAGGNNLSIEQLFSEIGTNAIDPSYLAAHFNPDATFFIYRDANGFWPGYVLALNPGENLVSDEASVTKIESSTELSAFFLGSVGTPSTDGFTDSMIQNTPVRVLPFTAPTSISYFTYGWYQSKLVISASQAGFAAAISRL